MLIKQYARRESNPQRTDSKSIALSIELRAHSLSAVRSIIPLFMVLGKGRTLNRVVGESDLTDIQGTDLLARLSLFGMRLINRILLKCRVMSPFY